MERNPGEALDFAELYARWYRPVYRWITALGGHGIDAEDLTQEVFIVVQRKLSTFDCVNLAGWLYRIAQLTVRDHRRRAWFRKIFLRARDMVLDEIVGGAASPEDLLAAKQRQMYLYHLIQQINPRWRTSFVLSDVAGFSSTEIARLEGISPATVRTHLFRARQEIRGLATRTATRRGR
jgi:RNA polymerase sigma-70 factor, ECF subfamily